MASIRLNLVPRFILYFLPMGSLQDLHRWKIAQEEARRKHIFISKTEELRRMMVHVQLTQPYREEQVCEGVRLCVNLVERGPLQHVAWFHSINHTFTLLLVPPLLCVYCCRPGG